VYSSVKGIYTVVQTCYHFQNPLITLNRNCVLTKHILSPYPPHHTHHVTFCLSEFDPSTNLVDVELLGIRPFMTGCRGVCCCLGMCLCVFVCVDIVLTAGSCPVPVPSCLRCTCAPAAQVLTANGSHLCLLQLVGVPFP
jgi:hypothetical protein